MKVYLIFTLNILLNNSPVELRCPAEGIPCPPLLSSQRSSVKWKLKEWRFILRSNLLQFTKEKIMIKTSRLVSLPSKTWTVVFGQSGIPQEIHNLSRLTSTLFSPESRIGSGTVTKWISGSLRARMMRIFKVSSAYICHTAWRVAGLKILLRSNAAMNSISVLDCTFLYFINYPTRQFSSVHRQE